MNYLSVIDHLFIDCPGGAARVAWDTARAVLERGDHVSLLCKGRPAGVQEIEGVRVVRCQAQQPTYDWAPGRATIYSDVAAQAFRQYLSDRRWDVIHLHTPILGAGVARAAGDEPTVVYTMHSPVAAELKLVWARQGVSGWIKRLFGAGMLQRIESRLLQRSERIQVLSRFAHSLLIAAHPEQADKVSIIPHWRRPELRRTVSKLEARRQLGWPVDQSIFFTLRSLTPRCGLEVAIDAIAPLAQRGDCYFAIGGQGPLRAALESRARDRGTSPDQIALLGVVSEEQMILAYQAADAFILPTVALECFGLIVLEAMALGCPVIASDVAAIPELISPVSPGLLVRAGDPLDLRRKLELFLTGQVPVPSPEQLVDYVQAQYSRERRVPEILEFIRGMPPVRSGLADIPETALAGLIDR